MEDLQRSPSNTIPHQKPNEEEQTNELNEDEEENGEDVCLSPRKIESEEEEEINPNQTTFFTHAPPQTDLKPQPDTSDHNSNIKSNDTETDQLQAMLVSTDLSLNRSNDPDQSLNEYLYQHQRFLNSIEHHRQLSFDQRRQLDREKLDLRQLQIKLNKQIEDQLRMDLYEIQRQNDIARKRNAFLLRRSQENKLKESRKARIQTTFRLSQPDKRSKSQINSKRSPTPSPRQPIPTRTNQPSQPTHNHRFNDVACQTDSHHLEKSHVEHGTDQHLKDHSDEVGKSLREVITHFVEHSRLTWNKQ